MINICEFEENKIDFSHFINAFYTDMPRRTKPSVRLPRNAYLWPYFLAKVRELEGYDEIRTVPELRAFLRLRKHKNKITPSPFRTSQGKRKMIDMYVLFWKTVDAPNSVLYIKNSPLAGTGLFAKYDLPGRRLVRCGHCLEQGEDTDFSHIADNECGCPLGIAIRVNKPQSDALARGSNPKNISPYNFFDYLVDRWETKSLALMSGAIAMSNHACRIPYTNISAPLEVKVKNRLSRKPWMLKTQRKIRKDEELMWNYGKYYWVDGRKCLGECCSSK